jgi:hypothetical protein
MFEGFDKCILYEILGITVIACEFDSHPIERLGMWHNFGLKTFIKLFF